MEAKKRTLELSYLYKNVKTGNYEITWVPPETEKDSIIGLNELEYVGQLPEGAIIKSNRTFKEFSHDAIMRYLCSHENNLSQEHKNFPLEVFLQKKNISSSLNMIKELKLKISEQYVL